MEQNNTIMGVILAGGKGSRMYPFSDHYPKCILPICNQPLMEYQIEMMKGLGIDDIVILIGQYGFDVVRVIGSGERYGVKIQYVDQGQTLGIAHALGKLEQFVDRPFLLFLGDIFFITESLKPMVAEFERGDCNAVLATKVEEDIAAIKRNFTVIQDEDGMVKRVIEKPRHPSNNLKGCGLYLFDLHIFDAIRRTPRTAMRDEYEITDSIQILINDEFRVKAATVIQGDLNLTYPDDLLHINLIELKRRNIQRLIGKNISVNNEQLIDNSIIGDNVSILGKAKIRNSVIFSDTVLELKEDIENSIATPEKLIYCYGAIPRENGIL
jgi:dTDP-glucose pyrophosphorylase